MTISRRTFLAAAGFTAGTGLLSACGSGPQATTGPNGVKTSLQVFSWWTAGGELQALDALKANFNLHNPNIEFINEAVAGGAGTNAKAELAKRLAAGNPPDTFQASAGTFRITSWRPVYGRHPGLWSGAAISAMSRRSGRAILPSPDPIFSPSS